MQDPNNIPDEDHIDLQPQTIRTPREMLKEQLAQIAKDAVDRRYDDAEREQLAGGSLYCQMTVGGGK
jgi:hypothetical protein